MIRRQLPAFSPMSFSAWAGAVRASVFRSEVDAAALSKRLLSRFEASSAILTGSGTQALQLAMVSSCAPGPSSGGPVVALPAFSCYDLVTAAVGAGVRMVFYDLDPRTLSPDMDSFDQALAAKPKAVVVGNLFGYPVDWRSVRARCGEDGPVLIEDAAQGLGSAFGGREGGTFGDMTVLSFSRGKGWTGGGGGALLFRGGREAAVGRGPDGGRGLMAAVTSLAQLLLGRPGLYGIPSALPGLQLGETHFQEAVPPHGIRRFSARLASLTEAQALAEVDARKANAERLLSILGEDAWKGILRPSAPVSGGEASYLRLPVVLEAPLGARPVHRELSRWGVAGSYPLALPDLPEGIGLTEPDPGRFPGAEILSSRLLTFPTHSLLKKKDFDAYRGLIKCFATKRTIPF